MKQVIVVRKDLNMRKGKIAAQSAHASMSFLTSRIKKDLGDIRPAIYRKTTPVDIELTSEEIQWLDDGFAKIVVYVDSEKELLDVYHKALAAKLTAHIIKDSGHTEFHGVPTLTCLAIGPHSVEKIDPITGNLPLM